MTQQLENPTLLQRPVAWLLVAAAALSLSLLGGTIYASYRITHPQDGIQLAREQGTAAAIEDLRNAAGYNGFAGAMVRFAANEDDRPLAEMRAAHAELYRALAALRDNGVAAAQIIQLRGIFNAYDKAIKQAENATTAPASRADLVTTAQTLAAMQPLVDNRLDKLAAAQAAGESATWSRALFWLALAGASLGVVLAALLYRLLTDNMMTPMQNLRRSIALLSHDSEAAIWGVERQDAIGDVARAVDIARYQFTQVPDISLISDQGPVRLKFEGEASSLFEAMTQLMMDSSRNMVNDANKLAGVLHMNREGLERFMLDVQAMIRKLTALSAEHGEKIAKLNNALSLATTLARENQQAVIGRIEKVLPRLEQRSESMGSVVSDVGKQLRELVQSLLATERMLHVTASQAHQTSESFGKEAGELTERLFAAASLLRNSGEVLAETTDLTRSNMKDTVDTLKDAEATLFEFLEQSTTRLDKAVTAVEAFAGTAKGLNANASLFDNTMQNVFVSSELLSEQVAALQDNNPGALKASLSEILAVLMDIAVQMKRLGETRSLATAATGASLAPELPGQPQEQLESTLNAMNDIFASLRDRGDDVINRLNQVAESLNDGTGNTGSRAG
ncbi:MAG: hypothetical protein GC131_02220 [Alphaproteobacteria bacterium]|nr:hypothetical protein [Alphaproteobacteria bacterium]